MESKKPFKRIVNLVDDLGTINYGIWNSAIATSAPLSKHFNIKSELWYPKTGNIEEFDELKNVHLFELENTSKKTFDNLVKNLDKEVDIIVSHGCWRWPTVWGSWFKKAGFRWMYVPHGMLEPWSMQQKSLKKWPYFWFVEKPMALRADVVRAVGAPEADNLKNHFSKVTLIANGVEATTELPIKAATPVIFLFMARLHFKKGPLNLVKAWKNSRLNSDPNFQLLIAGPDEGELAGIKEQIKGANNIFYVGAIYGEAKIDLLQKAHFYVLPSLSEGFPTSVVEGMMYGQVPVISRGCNFPEVFGQQLGFDSGASIESIQEALQQAATSLGSYAELQREGYKLVKTHYSIEAIAQRQEEVFASM